MKQEALIAIPRRPSPTAATMRVNRRKARAWAAERGLVVYAKADGRFCYDDCSGFNTGHAWDGAMVPLACASGEAKPLCWDCIPYLGAPVRNHESHSTDVERAVGSRCIRCERPTADVYEMQGRRRVLVTRGTGGVFQRGGPFCWDCGSPERAPYDAWLLRLREDPNAAPPWKGDKVTP